MPLNAMLQVTSVELNPSCVPETVAYFPNRHGDEFDRIFNGIGNKGSA